MVLHYGIGSWTALPTQLDARRSFPQRGWSRRISQIAVSTAGSICHGCSRGRCDPSPKPERPSFPLPPKPSVQRPARHPESLGDLDRWHTRLDLQNGPIPLLHHAQLHQHSAECHPSVNPLCNASSGPGHPSERRVRTPIGEDFLCCFKAAAKRPHPPSRRLAASLTAPARRTAIDA
jgi:hypothetical protein